MNTEQNTDFEDVNDQTSHEENQLNQGFERTEGDPSWSEEQEETQDLESDEVSNDETQISDDHEENEDDVEDDAEQKNTPQGDSRRVLSFSDYFGNQNS